VRKKLVKDQQFSVLLNPSTLIQPIPLILKDLVDDTQSNRMVLSLKREYDKLV